MTNPPSTTKGPAGVPVKKGLEPASPPVTAPKPPSPGTGLASTPKSVPGGPASKGK